MYLQGVSTLIIHYFFRYFRMKIKNLNPKYFFVLRENEFWNFCADKNTEFTLNNLLKVEGGSLEGFKMRWNFNFLCFFDFESNLIPPTSTSDILPWMRRSQLIFCKNSFYQTTNRKKIPSYQRKILYNKSWDTLYFKFNYLNSSCVSNSVEYFTGDFKTTDSKSILHLDRILVILQFVDYWGTEVDAT